MKFYLLFALVACLGYGKDVVELAGKVALVTGSTRGIGMDTGKYLASLGVKVIFSGRSVADGEAIVAGVVEAGHTAAFVKLDVTKEEDMAAAFAFAEDLYGGVDFVFANAGALGQFGIGLDNLDIGLTRLVMDVNVVGSLLTLKYAHKAMVKRGGGAIVFTSSIASTLPHAMYASMPFTSLLSYSASKAAINMIVTGTAALAVGETPIRGYALAPAVYNTHMVEKEALSAEFCVAAGIKTVKEYAGFNPVFPGSPGNPADVGPMVASLFANSAHVEAATSVLIDNDYMFPMHSLKGHTFQAGGTFDLDLSKALDKHGQPSPLTPQLVEAILHPPKEEL